MQTVMTTKDMIEMVMIKKDIMQMDIIIVVITEKVMISRDLIEMVIIKLAMR